MRTGRRAGCGGQRPGRRLHVGQLVDACNVGLGEEDGAPTLDVRQLRDVATEPGLRNLQLLGGLGVGEAAHADTADGSFVGTGVERPTGVQRTKRSTPRRCAMAFAVVSVVVRCRPFNRKPMRLGCTFAASASSRIVMLAPVPVRSMSVRSRAGSII